MTVFIRTIPSDADRLNASDRSFMCSKSKCTATREFQPTIRYVGDVVVFFRDKHTIIVKQGSTMVIFHRWFERHTNDFKQSWQPFCRALMSNKKLSLYECYRLANKCGIDAQHYSGGLSVPQDIRTIGKKDGTKW